METSIIISGFGGQGALFAGQLLTYAGMDSGHNVTWFPSYGPEMRGGTAHCTVIISDESIGAPVVARPDIAIVLNGPSFEKYEPLLIPGGLLVVNSSIVGEQSARTDIDTIYIPANGIAEEFGSVKMLNMATLGAMLAQRPIFSLELLEQTLTGHLPANKGHLLGKQLSCSAAWLRGGIDDSSLDFDLFIRVISLLSYSVAEKSQYPIRLDFYRQRNPRKLVASWRKRK